jgi:hypothetical protein
MEELMAPTLEEKLANARKELKRWSSVAASPSTSRDMAVVALQMKRSLRAQLVLIEKAIAHRDRGKRLIEAHGVHDLTLAWRAMNGELPAAREDSEFAKVIERFFPEPYEDRQRQYAHAIVAELRREGDASPERVERMVALARGVYDDLSNRQRELALYVLLNMPPPRHLVEWP